MEPLTCEMCGAPMKDRKECMYCGTCYYIGPELQEKPPEFMGMSAGLAMNSSAAVFSTCMVGGTQNLVLTGYGY